MAKSSTWVTIGCAAVAVGLLVDNLRLRAEIEALETQTAANTQLEMTAGKRSPSIDRTRNTTARTAPKGTAADNARAEEIEVEIEEEVAARLKHAVDEKIDKDLDTLVEERVERRMEEHHDQRRERHRAALDEHIAEYVADKELSDEAEANLVSLMDEASANIGEVFRAVHRGEIEREAAHEEVQEVREEIRSSLVEMLGEDEAEEFAEGLRGPLGRGWRPRR